MREILFRGKTFSGDWVYGSYEFSYLYDTSRETHRIISADKTSKTNFLAEVIPETIGQYTGLTDKNGNKIFENDIVTLFGEKYVVKWKNSNCTYIIENGNIGTKIIEFPSDYYEIIGNIFDNKELL